MTLTARLSRPSLILLALLLSALVAGCQKAPADEANEAKKEEEAAPVKWESAKRESLEEWTEELPGTTQPLPDHIARVTATVEGRVLAVLPAEHGKPVVEGQQVEAGQVLARLDDYLVRASRDKLLGTKAELVEQEKQARYAIELARIDVERMRNLNSGGETLVSRIDLEKARVMLKDAGSKHEGILARQEAVVAELKSLEEQAALYTLRSPIAGRLGLVHVVIGQTLPVGTVVAEVVALDPFDVLCFVPMSTASRLRLGQEARLPGAGGHDGEGGAEAAPPDGRVVFVGAQAQPETGLVAVKVRFPNQKRGLRANAVQAVQVLVGRKKDCLTIPEKALMEDQDPPTVLVVEAEKKEGKDEYTVHKRQAVLGMRDYNKHVVEVLGLKDPESKKDVPLDEKTLFVTEGGHGLEDDEHVKPEEEHKDEKEGAAKDEKKPEKDEK
jgi:RND family efflux transporter MFP subunit